MITQSKCRSLLSALIVAGNGATQGQGIDEGGILAVDVGRQHRCGKLGPHGELVLPRSVSFLDGPELRRHDLAVEGCLEHPVQRIKIEDRGICTPLVLESDAVAVEFRAV